MTTADRVLDLIRKKSDLTEAQLASEIFGSAAYQQRVNSSCRRLIKEGKVQRRGHGGPGDPFRYHAT
jgi:hypothetical protein